mmetsp:Transcript_20308/g.43947  ORF Transcript_20308/g.43947 Transcript_20308/m.43947 type:complete len:624 (-) Transcript_20308:405-2276(-)
MALALAPGGMASAKMIGEPGNEESRRCRGCLSTDLRVDWSAGDRVCTSCGLVDEERLLEQGAEWREFDDADDIVRNAFSGSGGAARCGLVPTNEQLWVGGLQPTSLSKHVVGRPTPTSSMTRKRLLTANQRLDRQVEKRHAAEIKIATLSLQIQKQRQSRANGDGDESVRPEFEQLLEHEEEDALATTAALYADKWSLNRAIQLFGEGHEVSSVPAGSKEDLDGLRNGLDETLITAARDLYKAYRMLLATTRALDLPDRVTNEACLTLVNYAKQRDGLAVRGVSSNLKAKHKNGGEQFGKVPADSEVQAKEALREFNKMKQMGSLVAAIVFYTARNLSWPRSLAQVCSSVETPSSLTGNRHLDIGKEKFIKLKHCSKGMNEIKQIFPHFARSSAIPAASASLENASTETFVEHVTKKLRLPPVAEASIRALMTAEEEQKNGPTSMQDSTKAKNRFIVCAAVSYFVCQIGDIMQNLAQQASASNQARPAMTPRKKRKLSKKHGGEKILNHSDQDERMPDPETKPFDLFRDEAPKSEEHRLYEMRRVWDAWREQTTWRRNVSEIEEVCGVSRSSWEQFFRTSLYPKRRALLKVLETHSSFEKVPLASVLLPHVAITEPLMKDCVR